MSEQREVGGIASLGRFGLFCAAFARASLTNPPPLRRSIEEAYRIGVRSLPVLVVISAFVGTTLAFQGYYAFQTLGGESYLGLFVALAGVREMVPIMVAAMVAAKAGTEMASHIAVMRSKEQIDALEVMAIDPLWYLVTPRFIGILVVLPALTVISVATMLLAAYALVVLQLGENGAQFWSVAFGALDDFDFAKAMVKGASFAVIICLVSCWFGFKAQRGPAGVGQATNGAVVWSAVTCAVINYFLSELLHGR